MIAALKRAIAPVKPDNAKKEQSWQGQSLETLRRSRFRDKIGIRCKSLAPDIQINVSFHRNPV